MTYSTGFLITKKCRRGHPIDVGNIYIVQTKRDGLKCICAECQRRRSRESKRRRAARKVAA